jgi:hypothetical protein
MMKNFCGLYYQSITIINLLHCCTLDIYIDGTSGIVTIINGKETITL